MAAAAAPRDWRLESFIEALIFELDKAQDALSIKGINRKLTYTVKDVAVDLNVFPDYADDDLRFSVAKPGEDGASRISFQLGSITDQQIKETTRDPGSDNDIIIGDVEEIDADVRRKLRKLGVKSGRDLERVQRRNVALPEIVADEGTVKKDKVSYNNLADIISRARRGDARPEVKSIAMSEQSADSLRLQLDGENLFLDETPPGFPLAMLNAGDVDARRDGDSILIEVPRPSLRAGKNSLSVAIDDQVVLQLNLNWESEQ